MCSLPNISELNDCTNEYRVQQQNRRGSRALKRLFSTDSLATKSKSVYELYPSKNYEYSLCGIEFVLKIGQIVSVNTTAYIETLNSFHVLTVNINLMLWIVHGRCEEHSKLQRFFSVVSECCLQL